MFKHLHTLTLHLRTFLFTVDVTLKYNGTKLRRQWSGRWNQRRASGPTGSHRYNRFITYDLSTHVLRVCAEETVLRHSERTRQERSV